MSVEVDEFNIYAENSSSTVEGLKVCSVFSANKFVKIITIMKPNTFE